MDADPKLGLERANEFEASLSDESSATIPSETLRLAESIPIEEGARTPSAPATDPAPPLSPQNDAAEAGPPQRSPRARSPSGLESAGGSSGIHAPKSGPASAGARASMDPHERWVGKRLAHFRIMRQLGQGTMGVVFQVEDVNLKRIAALKVLRRNIKGSDKAPQVDRFLMEARVAASLDHPSIATVYEINQFEGWWYIAMEYLEGGSLQHLLSKAGPLPPGRASLMLADAARGLAVAHDAGVIHRDLKPANLMLSRLGRCKLVDFGLVKVDSGSNPFHEDTEMVGTPHYMAPEVARHLGATTASDVYSLGVTLYVLLTGDTPFHAKSIKELLKHHISTPAPDPREKSPNISANLAELIAQSLHKQPELRPSAEIFAASLQSEVAASGMTSDTSSASGSALATVASNSLVPGNALRTGGGSWDGSAGSARSAAESIAPGASETSTAQVRRARPWWAALALAIILTGLGAAWWLSSAGGGGSARPARTNSIGMQLVPLAAGTFTMGSPTTEPRRHSDERTVQIRFMRPVLIGTTEVTQSQWSAVMGENYKPPEGTHPNDAIGRRFMGPDLPAYASWPEAAEFCRRLSLSENKHYRLPTEAEWEYACRAGTTTAYHTGATLDAMQANIDTGATAALRPLPVASFPPNAWGLYDMHGNVMEWCSDWKDSYPLGPLTDPTGPTSGTGRVVRGGSWDTYAEFARAANRWSCAEALRTNYIGFRVVLDPGKPVPKDAPSFIVPQEERASTASVTHLPEGAIANPPAVDPALPDYTPEVVLTQRMRSVGSDTMDRLLQMWERVFKASHPSLGFRHEGKGSSTAVGALAEGFAHIGPMSRALKDAEKRDFLAEHGYEPLQVTVAMDAVAVYVNARNPLLQRGLTMKEVDAIFSATLKQGGPKTVSTWGELGLDDPEWRDRPIRVFGRNKASGTSAVMREVGLRGGEYRSDIALLVGSAELVERIAADPYAIGYSGIGYHREDVVAVPLSAGGLEERSGPTLESVRAGRYPMARPLFLTIDLDPEKGPTPLHREFLGFVFSRQGQEIVGKAGFYPVTAEDAGRELKRAGIE